MIRFLLIVLVTLFLYSCGSDKVLIKRINLLETKIESNSERIEKNTDRINSIEKELKIIKQKLKKEMAKNNFIYQIPAASVVDNLTNLKSNINSSNTSLSSNATTKNTAGKLATVSKFNVVEVPKSQNSSARKPKSTHENYKKLYKSALNLYYRKEYHKAEALFKKFISKYKNTSLYDNSLYWLSYCYIHEDKINKAVELLKLIIKKFPFASLDEGGKTDGAIFTLIDIYKRRGNLRKEDYYKTLLFKRFPHSMYIKFIKQKGRNG